MNVLVTGGAGYIGSHVVRQLRDQGHQVCIVDNLSNGYRANLISDVSFYAIDLFDNSELTHLFYSSNFDAVFHFAGSISVTESVLQPLDYYDNNSFITLELLKLCKWYGVKYFVFSSTAAVYDSSEQSLLETSILKPANPYGWSKLFSEQIIQDVSKTCGMKFAILRYFNVAGADPLGRMGQRNSKATHLIKRALQVAGGLDKELKIFGTDYPTPDGTAIRDYIHVEDLASAHVLVLKALSEFSLPSDIFNVGYGKGYSVKEVIKMAEKVIGKKLNVVETDRRMGDSAILVANPEKIRSTLGWTPQFNSLKKIIGDAWNFEQALKE